MPSRGLPGEFLAGAVSGLVFGSERLMKKPDKSSQPRYEPRGYGVIRDYVESVAMAIILALLFRMFLLEAFVIPTGSMAPTLHGRHMDVECSQCGFQYQTGASSENPDTRADQRSEIIETACPLCRFSMSLDKASQPNQRSFMGDRILVSKFSYSVSQPKRWQVIVFKFPGNAKQNYIKRLVGLPGERIKIKGGDIYVVPPEESDREAFQIVRKPANKLLAMMQLVHDSNYVPESLEKVGWPRRWRPWAPDGESAAGVWTTKGNQSGYHTAGKTDQICLLRYRHLVPDRKDWDVIERGLAADSHADSQPDAESLDSLRQQFAERFSSEKAAGQLITDYYAYNHGSVAKTHFEGDVLEAERPTGFHWVGDLAAEFEVEVKGNEGKLLLDLVEGGTHFQCTIDIKTGRAILSRRDKTGKSGVFTDGAGWIEKNPVGRTKITKQGSYRLRFSNIDDELLLWVNNRLISFQGPTTYETEPVLTPHWQEKDPGDLAPVGIGTRALALHVKRMKVFRDVYYVALAGVPRYAMDYLEENTPDHVRSQLADYKNWEQNPFFKQRREQVIPGPGSLGPDEFLPMGDNSPESSDGRMWPFTDADQKHTVPRRLLIGQAMFVYWPHSWRLKTGSSGQSLPVGPNFKQMRLIK